MSTSTTGNIGKLAFSLKSKKKSTSKKAVLLRAEGFEAPEAGANQSEEIINPDIPREPLVIPVQEDGRKSLQEQAKLRREKDQPSSHEKVNEDKDKDDENSPKVKEEKDAAVVDAEDQAAIDALQADANEDLKEKLGQNKMSKMVIDGAENTFQTKEMTDDTEQFQQDLERLAPEVSVESETYRQVPIAEFGAAMLRGMGWTGMVNTSDKDQSLPRPSRLGLGAVPKMLDAPTHSGRRPRRQDQVKREEQLRQQQKEYEQQRQQQVQLDKQRTTQVGSIVSVVDTGRRAIVRQWQGVPGLNMVLVQYEGDAVPTKAKKGSVQLVDRSGLQKEPFDEPEYRREEKAEFLGKRRSGREEKDDDRQRSHRDEKHRRRDDDDGDRKCRDDKGRRRLGKDDERDGRRRGDDDRRRSREDDDRRKRRDDDDDRHNRRKGISDSDRRKRRKEEDARNDRKRQRRQEERPRSSTWLIPNIRVRVISTKLGKPYYKEKGVVVDVTAKGSATLKMSNGQVVQAPERYLETALPKVGGRACILVGDHRWAKGRLLERDSKANQGAIQVFEDMNIVTTSLDDMAEWCGPLDDDLME